VQVLVRQDGPTLELDITDRGGVDPTVRGDGSGQGIPGMRERAAALGGSLEAGPVPGGGFRVHATLPVPGGSG
jgi:signal transduction histidine kinase